MRGRPRNKKYKTEHRTCTRADKERQRVTRTNRTLGWQFVNDPVSRRTLAAKEHIVNEACADKVEAVQTAMALPKVKANALVHDDACYFEKYVHLRKLLRKAFRCIKQMLVDDFRDATTHVAKHI